MRRNVAAGAYLEKSSQPVSTKMQLSVHVAAPYFQSFMRVVFANYKCMSVQDIHPPPPPTTHTPLQNENLKCEVDI